MSHCMMCGAIYSCRKTFESRTCARDDPLVLAQHRARTFWAQFLHQLNLDLSLDHINNNLARPLGKGLMAILVVHMYIL